MALTKVVMLVISSLPKVDRCFCQPVGSITVGLTKTFPLLVISLKGITEKTTPPSIHKKS